MRSFAHRRHRRRVSGMVWKPVGVGLRISERHDQDVARVRLAGELDLATAPEALRILLDVAGRSRQVVVDLAWVTFLDAFACGRLVEAHAAVSASGGRLVLQRPHPRVRRVLTLADLGGLVSAASGGVSASMLPTSKVTSILEGTIEAALRLPGVDMANAQLLDPTSQSLRIVSQHGFTRKFLDFFDIVDGAESACGAALVERHSVWVSDVSQSPIFAGTPALDAVLDANARSVASIPLERPTGELVGMFSVHRRRTGAWSEQERHELERIGRRAGRQLALS